MKNIRESNNMKLTIDRVKGKGGVETDEQSPCSKTQHKSWNFIRLNMMGFRLKRTSEPGHDLQKTTLCAVHF